MHIYPAIIDNNDQFLYSTHPFLFVNNSNSIGQLIRSTMFSFNLEQNDTKTLALCISNYKLISFDTFSHTTFKFEFKANSEIQTINKNYKIQFQEYNGNYCCPTLYFSS
jgi:hypothetical protein